MQSESAQFLLQSFAVAEHLPDVLADVLLIAQSFWQNRERSRVDAVRRSHAANHRHLPGLSGKNSNSQTGKAVGLGKSPRHEKILDPPGVIDKRFSVKFEIRLIDQHGYLRRCLRNLNQDI